MSTKAVLAWLGLAIALGVVAIVLLRPPSPASASPTSDVIALGNRLFTFAPSSVQSVRVAHPDGSVEVIDRASASTQSAARGIGSDAEWFVRSWNASSASSPPPDGAGAGIDEAWPVVGSNMQGLLRKLVEVEAIALASASSQLGERPTIVTLTLRDTTQVTLRLAERTMAGSGLVEIVQGGPATTGGPGSSAPALRTRRAIVDDELHRVFREPGPLAWRERAPLSGVALDASRIHFENARQRLVLAKLNGQWSVREPISAPADPAIVQRVLGQLTALSIEEFLDAGAPGQGTGLENAAARLTVESDRRLPSPDSAEPTTVTAKVELSVGGPADAGSKRMFASIDGARLVLLDAGKLADISMNAAGYIWPFATRTSSSDVGGVTLIGTEESARLVLKRTLNRWSRVAASGQEEMLAEQELKDADALVWFLTGAERSNPGSVAQSTSGTPGAPGTGVKPIIEVTPPESWRTLGTIELRNLSGGPTDTIEIGTSMPGTLSLRSGEVYRRYPLNRVPPILAQLFERGTSPKASASDEPTGK